MPTHPPAEGGSIFRPSRYEPRAGFAMFSPSFCPSLAIRVAGRPIMNRLAARGVDDLVLTFENTRPNSSVASQWLSRRLHVGLQVDHVARRLGALPAMLHRVGQTAAIWRWFFTTSSPIGVSVPGPSLSRRSCGRGDVSLAPPPVGFPVSK